MAQGVGAAAEVLLYEQTELSASRKVLAPALQVRDIPTGTGTGRAGLE